MPDEQAKSLANLDQLWADIRQHREDILIIAEHGLPKADDDGAAAYHDKLVRMMACVVAAESGQRQLGSGWISVKDRLPPAELGWAANRTEYLVYGDGSFYLATYDKSDDNRPAWWADSCEGMTLEDITHWMSLPEPP